MAGARDTSETGDTRDTRDIAAAAGTGFVRSLVADPAYGPLYGLLLTLSVVTGVVDAVSILTLGRVFVALGGSCDEAERVDQRCLPAASVTEHRDVPDLLGCELSG